MVQIAFAIEADVRNVSSLKYVLAWFLKFPGLRRKEEALVGVLQKFLINLAKLTVKQMSFIV